MKTIFYYLIFLMTPCALFSASTDTPQVVIMLGAPASGKGTQAVQLAKHLSIPHISTGDLFRVNIEKNTDLGKKVKKDMDEGKLVPDSLVLEMLFNRISEPDAARGYVLDGFPRTIAQAEALEKKLPKNASLIVLNLSVPDETCIVRAMGRKRSDDNLEVVKERLRNYYAQTAPLIEFYKKKGLLKTINGEKSPEEVFQELKQAIPNSHPK